MSITYTRLTDDQLKDMDLPSLQAYYAEVSTSIGIQTSTINHSQSIQAQYDYLILRSQSTVNGLGYEITATSNAIIEVDARSNVLVQSNIILDSTIIDLNSSIMGNTRIIDAAKASIITLTLEHSTINSNLVKSDEEFKRAATQYSSLYMTFMARDQMYKNCLSNISTTSSLLTVAENAQKISYTNWQTSSAFAVAKSGELSTLYLNSNAIQSTLTQLRINENIATTNLQSTNTGIVAISSLYKTALINQKYYQSLSTQSGVLDMYTAAYSTFMTASALARAAPTNTILSAASEMSRQRLATLTTTRDQVATQTTALQSLVAGATTDTYAITLKSAQDAVQLEIENVNKFQVSMNSSIAAVTYYSSLHNQATNDIVSSMAAVRLFSSLYVSSIAGSDVIMKRVRDDTSTIAKRVNDIATLDIQISSLNRQYTNHISGFNGWITYSTVMKQKIAEATTDIIRFSSLFESTNLGVIRLRDDLVVTDRRISDIRPIIRTQSSILEAEFINMQDYQAQIAAAFNLEEQATYRYRETFARQKRIARQQEYDTRVLQSVQATSTQNGNLAVQAAGAPFQQVAVNINTPIVNAAYTELLKVSAFLTTFASISSIYDSQTQNMQRISTAIREQRLAFSTLTKVSDTFRANPTNTVMGQAFSNAQATFISRQAATLPLKSNVTATQAQINSAKATFLTTYNTIFSPTEIMTNEITISSFLIQGFNTAVSQ